LPPRGGEGPRVAAVLKKEKGTPLATVRDKVPLRYCTAPKKTGETCGGITPNAPSAGGKVAARWNLCAWHAQLAALEAGEFRLSPGFVLVSREQQVG
jgi:hypothetical protein